VAFRLVRFLILIALGVCLAHADDDDTRTNVYVKTKRQSLTARSLPHVIDLAEQHSPVIQTAKGTLEGFHLAYEIAARRWLPSLDLTSGVGAQGQQPHDSTITTPWLSNTDLVLSETFYDNGVSLTNYEIARTRFDRARIEFEIARDQQLLNAANAYYDWSAALQQREIVEINREMLKRHHDALDIAVRRGTKTRKDVLRIEQEMKRIELNVLDSDNLVDLSFQKLAAVIGMSREELTEEDLEREEAKPFLHYEADLPDLKPKDHRQAKIYDLQGKEAALNTRLTQRTDWPQLQLSGAAGYHNGTYIDNPGGIDLNRLYTWNTMVTLTYNLWDWGIRDRQLQQARITESNTNKTNEQAMFDLGTTLRDLGNQLRSLRANVKLTRELMAGEQQSYSILEADYRDGKSSYLDLITNLNSLIDARSKFIASYFGFRKEQALYSFHKGDLYTSLRE